MTQSHFVRKKTQKGAIIVFECKWQMAQKYSMDLEESSIKGKDRYTSLWIKPLQKFEKTQRK